MSTFNWTTLTNGQIVSFVPTADLLSFDDPLIAAAGVAIATPSATSTSFSFGGKTVTFNGLPLYRIASGGDRKRPVPGRQQALGRRQ